MQRMECTLINQVGAVHDGIRGAVRSDEGRRGGIQRVTQRIHNLHSDIYFARYVTMNVLQGQTLHRNIPVNVLLIYMGACMRCISSRPMR